MSDPWRVFRDELVGYARFAWNDLLHPGWHSFFWMAIAVSLLVWVLEIALPWRRDQGAFRRGFWLDAFYVVFYLLLFPVAGFAAVSAVVQALFHDALAAAGVRNLVAIEVASWPGWAQLLLLFAVRDFVHWNIHRLLHRVPWLWRYHKVHHSVIEMGFAAQLRFHWVELVVYRTLEYLPLAMIGFGVTDFAVVHVFAFTVGHLNHSNLRLPIGPLRYVLNTPQMHIWHHAKDLPPERRHGVNFGLTLSLWDWLFGTVWWPRDGRDIELGFPGIERYPQRVLLGPVPPQ